MAKTPRFSAYGKLLKRMYEVIFLLKELGKTQGPHLESRHDPNDEVATRRRFLRNLAYLCDKKAGGNSVTALAVEDLEECNKFWLATNEEVKKDDDDQPGVVRFLNEVLAQLREYPSLDEEDKAALLSGLTRDCISFAKKRVMQYIKILSNTAKKCIEHLRDDTSKSLGPEASYIIPWLQSFCVVKKESVNLFEFCQRAYDARRSLPMVTVARLARPPEDGSNPGPVSVNFKTMRHLVGRLANHIRVPKQLCEDAARVEKMLETYRVALVRPPAPVLRPDADGLMTFERILNRLIQPTNKRKGRLEPVLLAANQRLELERKIKESFNNESFRPRVHAEVQLLEHFYLSHGECRPFYAKDRYIACSKPACFCCKLYFRHHPARCVEPDSHQNVWPQWSPVIYPPSEDEEDFIERRRFLSEVIDEIREKVFERVLAPGGFAGDHRDTVTGITRSTNGDIGLDNLSDVAEADTYSSSELELSPSVSFDAVTEPEDDEIDPENGGVIL